MEVYLYNSTICRLCGEGNENGSFLYSCDENNQNLCDILNSYLPIKVSDDGLLPRTICPGCTIQVEATVEFINLIIKGQKIIRELLAREKEYKKSLLKSSNDPEVITDNIVYEINTSDGVYQVEHPIALQVAGLDKPKKKRGRPPKKPKDPEELAQEAAQLEKASAQDDTLLFEEPPSGKRRRKAPTRFREAVQGKELDRIFKEEGVTDGEESEVEVKQEAAAAPTSVPKEPEVIGHSETSGELVVVVKGKGRGRPRGRMRSLAQTCLACGRQFSCVGRYMAHVAAHGALQYSCAQCQYSATTRLELQQHQDEARHDGVTAKPLKALKAEEEDRLRKLQTEEVVELEDSTNVITEVTDTPEPVASQDTDLPGDFIAVVEDETPQMEVTQIDNGEKQEDDKEASKVDVKNGDEVVKGPNGKVKLKCNFCEKLFSNKQSKSIHIKAVHRGLREYACTVCGARFSYPRSLALHALAHERRAQRGFACDLCGKVLNHPSSVVYHKEAEHAGQRYVCSKCGKSFKHKQLLARHQLVHSQARPYSCKSCNASFKTKANLVNHQLLHSGIKKFSCEICKHKFAHKTSLTLHMRWHSGSKPYSCNTCGKRFSQKGNLSEHARIHSGEKPYVCSLCPRAFTTSSQRRLHAARHQRKNKNDRESVRVIPCPHCPLVFNYNAQLNRHKKQVHKQVSLLNNNQSQSRKAPIVSAEPTQDKRIIYVAYDEPETFQIIQPDEDESLSAGKVVETCELYSGSSLLVQHEVLDDQLPDQLPDQLHDHEIQSHLLHTDLLPAQTIAVSEGGTPLHLTMQDGTRLAITSADGNSLQVITEDGQTIPVEINAYTDDEEVIDNSEAIHQLSIDKTIDSDAASPVTHYFTIV